MHETCFVQLCYTKHSLRSMRFSYHRLLSDDKKNSISSDKLPSDRFWELEKRIREDKRATGVVVTNSRSKMIDNILDLLHEGAITLDDLSDFSEELQERIRFICSGGYNNPDNCNRL